MASKKKGLSLEEKRKKMMEIFFETKDVYLLKGKCCECIKLFQGLSREPFI
jgi:hypothetical protein